MVSDTEGRHSLTVDNALDFYAKYETGDVLGTGWLVLEVSRLMCVT